MICMVPELVATAVLERPSMAGFRASGWYPIAAATGSTFAVHALILANVIGFSATGLDGVSGFASVGHSAMASAALSSALFFFANATIRSATSSTTP